MSAFRYLPPIPETSPPAFLPFTQTIELRDGRDVVSRLTWQALPGIGGAYQLLWVETAEARRRQGHASHVLAEAVRQAETHARRAGRPMRQVVALVPQPSVNARAWLVRNGFVHVHTIEEMAPTGEVLVLVRTFV